MCPDGIQYCLCLAPVYGRDWMQGEKLSDWIKAHSEAWAMIPARLQNHIVVNNTPLETPSS